MRRQRRLTAGDQRDVERRAADIAGDHIGKPRLGGDMGGGNHARGGTGERSAHRQSLRGLDAHHAAIGLHNEEFAGEAVLAQPPIQGAQVRPHHRLQHGIQG